MIRLPLSFSFVAAHHGLTSDQATRVLDLLANTFPTKSRAALASVLQVTLDEASTLLNIVDENQPLACSKDWARQCPIGWAYLEGTCLAPFDYQGDCVPSISLEGLSPSKKRRLETVCDVSWPCKSPKRQNYREACPDTWRLNETGHCEAPDSYHGPCELSFAGDAYNDVTRELYGAQCGVSWPTLAECTCNSVNRSPCPLHWTEEAGQCVSPSEYVGLCGDAIVLSLFKDAEAACHLSSLCDLEWSCDRETRRYTDVADSFLQQMASIAPEDIRDVTDGLYKNGTLRQWMTMSGLADASCGIFKLCPLGWSKVWSEGGHVGCQRIGGGDHRPCPSMITFEASSPEDSKDLINITLPAEIEKELFIFAAACQLPLACNKDEDTFRSEAKAITLHSQRIESSPQRIGSGPLDDDTGQVVRAKESPFFAADVFDSLTRSRFLQIHTEPDLNAQALSSDLPTLEDFGMFTRTAKLRRKLSKVLSPTRLMRKLFGFPQALLSRLDEDTLKVQDELADEEAADRVKDGDCDRDYTRPCPLSFSQAGILCLSDNLLWQPPSTCPSHHLLGNLSDTEKSRVEQQCGVRWPCKTCLRDLVNSICPETWISREDLCIAPPDYVPRLNCPKEMDFRYMEYTARFMFAQDCGVEWPCFRGDCHKSYEEPCPKKFLNLPIGSEMPFETIGKFVICASTTYKGTCPSLWSIDHPLIDAFDDYLQSQNKSRIKRNTLTVWKVPMHSSARHQLEVTCDVEWPCGNTCAVDFKSACPYGWIYSSSGCSPGPKMPDHCGLSEAVKTDKWTNGMKQDFAHLCGAPWPCKNHCERDWTEPCPWGWSEKLDPFSQEMRCTPGVLYAGDCSGYHALAKLSFTEKQAFASRCQAHWPCLGYTWGVIPPGIFSKGRWQTVEANTDPVDKRRKGLLINI